MDGHIIGAYAAPAGQPDLFSIFGAANAQARHAALQLLLAHALTTTTRLQMLRLSGLFAMAGPEALREMQEAIVAREGCQLYGSLPVPRVAGNFYLSVNAQSFHVMRQVQASAAQLNTSHVIHQLSFGPSFPGAVNPLDGFVRTTGEVERTGTYKYFLKVSTRARRAALHAPGLTLAARAARADAVPGLRRARLEVALLQRDGVLHGFQGANGGVRASVRAAAADAHYIRSRPTTVSCPQCFSPTTFRPSCSPSRSGDDPCCTS